MANESAVDFETKSRVHIGMPVEDLERSMMFYRTLFGQEATKVRPHYAKFEVAEPPLNLSLNEVGSETGSINPVAHFGIQVKLVEAVKEVAGRLARAGFATKTEENSTCCYAVQTKIWAADPDGNKWEVYVVLDNDGAHHYSSESACCPEFPAMMKEEQRHDVAFAQIDLENASGMPACSCLTSRRP